MSKQAETVRNWLYDGQLIASPSQSIIMLPYGMNHNATLIQGFDPQTGSPCTIPFGDAHEFAQPRRRCSYENESDTEKQKHPKLYKTLATPKEIKALPYGLNHRPERLKDYIEGASTIERILKRIAEIEREAFGYNLKICEEEHDGKSWGYGLKAIRKIPKGTLLPYTGKYLYNTAKASKSEYAFECIDIDGKSHSIDAMLIFYGNCMSWANHSKKDANAVFEYDEEECKKNNRTLVSITKDIPKGTFVHINYGNGFFC